MEKLPGILPEDYPTVDFYGQPISGGGAAGAVQALTSSGYSWLGLSVNNSLLGSVSANPAPDEDGMVPNGSVTITARPSEGYSFEYWLQDGVKTTTANPYTLTINAHTRIEAVFGRVVTVNSLIDGAGSASQTTLRYALTNAQDGDIIRVNGPGVIELASPLPYIAKDLSIEGNGITLTRAASWTVIDNDSPPLIIGINTEVKISRVHFKDGRSTASAGAIINFGNLTLETCIFHSTSAVVGAINSSNTLTIKGCTFYGNTASSTGGAVFWGTGNTLTLTGNVFYGNTAGGGYPVVFSSGSTIIASYNVVDVAFGAGQDQCGWTAGTGDTTFTALGISTVPIDITTFAPLFSGLRNVLPATAPADFPTTDFYGNPRTFPGAPGAVN
jgi:hypothetical protein